jgi:hypothetical protein
MEHEDITTTVLDKGMCDVPAMKLVPVIMKSPPIVELTVVEGSRVEFQGPVASGVYLQYSWSRPDEDETGEENRCIAANYSLEPLFTYTTSNHESLPLATTKD